MDLPIICTLTPEQLLERKSTVLDAIRNAVLRMDRLPAGYAFEFPAGASMLAELQHLVELEQQCCRFLDFRILETATAIRLEVTGPPEATSIVTDFLGPATEPTEPTGPTEPTEQ